MKGMKKFPEHELRVCLNNGQSYILFVIKIELEAVEIPCKVASDCYCLYFHIPNLL